ncbi:Acyl-lipid (8-3)-desaturase [Pseudolycoriella hygida]|uniref:Acyl-lipid (8-3)-desaturase n=1 Tax=Pseudolycoriella hygida TaxID=35572 RepID=A0A9Q0MRW4_9DIPT|nr:Acyl-lipid (8-3)-desaturase [Pseudolycoriella hygida]
MATRKEILFDGYFYDVTDFIQKHPGGTVIEYYTEKGEDSTHAIQQFHKRSIEKVRLMMSALKKRPAADGEIGLDAAVLKKNRSLTEDLTKLYLELEHEGAFKPCYVQAFIRFVEPFLLAGIGISLFYDPRFAMQVLGILLMILARGRAALLVHELGHYSYSGNPKVDRIFQAILDGLFVGMSAARWRRQHNRHHAMPQRLHNDVDLETMPIFAFNAKVVRKPGTGKGFLIQNQSVLYFLNTLLVGLVWQFYQDPQFIIKRKCYLEFAAIVAHCAIFYQLGFWAWFLQAWLGSFWGLLTFSLNHTFLPVTEEPTHWFEYSLLHTANVEHAPWCDWITGYLNYQIEHHLFPTMPNFRLPFIKDRVRAIARKHNIPYIIHSYPEAVQIVFRNLNNVSKEASGWSRSLRTFAMDSIQANDIKRKEILFDGYLYDVTDFIKRHPGGNIISYYTQNGEDASQAIQQFHLRSIKRVKSLMNTLKKRPASMSESGLSAETMEKNRLLTEDFNNLYLELEKEGLFEPSFLHITLRVIEVIIMGLVGYQLLWCQNIFAKTIGIVLIGLTQGRCGWLQHESGHNSFSGNPKLDRIFHIIFIGLGMGFSSTWWTRQHNRHHSMPQRLNYDVDLKTLPLIAYNAKVVKRSNDGKSFMIRNQAYLFVLVDTLLIAILWKLYMHPKYVFQRRYYLQMMAMAGHWLFLYHIGFWPALISLWIKSLYLIVNFTLNHTFLPVTTESTHWIEYSLLHTADVEHSTWCNWWMAYLNYQIEHHLFPTMPQFRHPLITGNLTSLNGDWYKLQ